MDLFASSGAGPHEPVGTARPSPFRAMTTFDIRATAERDAGRGEGTDRSDGPVEGHPGSERGHPDCPFRQNSYRVSRPQPVDLAEDGLVSDRPVWSCDPFVGMKGGTLGQGRHASATTAPWCALGSGTLTIHQIPGRNSDGPSSLAQAIGSNRQPCVSVSSSQLKIRKSRSPNASGSQCRSAPSVTRKGTSVRGEVSMP